MQVANPNRAQFTKCARTAIPYTTGLVFKRRNYTNDNPIRIILPFKDHTSADILTRDLPDLSTKINKNLQPIFTSRKLIQDLRVSENNHHK